MPVSSTLNVDFLADAAGNSSPSLVNPPAAGDSSAHVPSTGWTQTELRNALAAAFTPVLAARDGSITNLFRVTAPNVTYSKGQRIRVRFDHGASTADTPLPFGVHTRFFAPLLNPDAVINTDTWLTDANLVATSTRTRGARHNARARVYQSNGVTSNSRVYSKYASANFAANTTYQVTLTVMYVAASGTFPTSGLALRIPYRDASNNPQYATVPISAVPTNSTYAEVSVTFTTGYASTGTYELLYGLNTQASFAVSDFRVVKMNNSPRLNIVGQSESPLMVQYDEVTSMKFNFQPVANSTAELEFDGVDWVVVSGQGSDGLHGRYLNGTTMDQCQLQGYDLGSTVVYTANQTTTVYAIKQSDLETGGKITIVNQSNFNINVFNGQGSTSSGDQFMLNGGVSSYYLSVPAKGSVTLTYVDPSFPILADGDQGISVRSVNNWGTYFGTSGYQKLPSGIIIQWGDVGYLGSNGASGQLITFNIAFPNDCLAIVTSDGGAGCNPNGSAKVSSSQFRVWGKNPANATYSDTSVRWMAIGY